MPPEQQLEREDGHNGAQSVSSLMNEARNLAFMPKKTFIGPPGTPPELRPLTQPVTAAEVELVFNRHLPYGARNVEELRKLQDSTANKLTPRERQVLGVAADNFQVISRLSNDETLRESRISSEDIRALGSHDTQHLGKAAKTSVVFDGLNDWLKMPGESTAGFVAMVCSTPWAVITAPGKMSTEAARYSAQKDNIAQLISPEGLSASLVARPAVPNYYEARQAAARAQAANHANDANANARSKNAGCGLAGGIVGYQMTKGGDLMTRMTGYMIGKAVAKAACNGIDAAIDAAKQNQELERHRRMR